MSGLAERICAEIAADGPMRLDRFMALALSDAEAGYYATRPSIGAAGDFVTAPEISQMFGEIVGAVLAHMWGELGRPDPVALVELGPGRGTLMADIWRTFAVAPGLREACRVHLVETSPLLRETQRRALEGLPVTWHDTLDDVPRLPMLLVANEFFDALPIRQLVRANSAWCERRVACGEDGVLAFVAAEPASPPEGRAFEDAPDGAIAELRDADAEIGRVIGARLAREGGAGLLIDYGYPEAAPGETLQALHGKRPAPPLEAPGEADLTAHVDFGALARAVAAGGGLAWGPVTQGAFLTALGIGLRAERLRRAGADPAGLDRAVERLTAVGAMGDLFKVLAVGAPGLAPPPPFDSRPAASPTSSAVRAAGDGSGDQG